MRMGIDSDVGEGRSARSVVVVAVVVVGAGGGIRVCGVGLDLAMVVVRWEGRVCRVEVGMVGLEGSARSVRLAVVV